MKWGSACAACVLFAGSVAAPSSLGETSSAPPLRIGTSGDYAPFSFSSPTGVGGFDGFDVVLARAFAETEGRPLELVRFRWPELESALREGRFDIAMSGVTVRPERSLAGRFSLPVAEGGAVALVRDGERFPDLAALERGRPHIVVNAGGHLERVARERFPNAQLEALSDNAQVRRMLLEGRADAEVSDSFEASEWHRGAGPLLMLGPFSRDRKAPLVRADLPELARHLDLWLFAREADGTLSAWRRTWFGDPTLPQSAAPLSALLAAADERLALMPLVAEAKRRAGSPIRDEAQEARVLEAALRAVQEEAARVGRVQPPQPAVRRVFQALIAAARHLEDATLGTPENEGSAELPSLDAALRPAVARITPKIAGALIRLEAVPPAAVLRERVRAELRTPHVGDADVREVADALSAYVKADASSVPAAEQSPASRSTAQRVAR